MSVPIPLAGSNGEASLTLSGNGGIFGWLSGPTSLGAAIDAEHATSAEDALTQAMQGFFGLSTVSLSYAGALEAAFVTDDFRIEALVPGLPSFQHGHGIMLSSGGFPGDRNTSPDFSVEHFQPGDPDLDATALTAFPGAGPTEDAAVIEFTIEVSDPKINVLRAELVFGSEEYPEFIDSEYVDIAAMYVNGANYAFFDGNPSRPLSIIRPNVDDGYIIDNMPENWADMIGPDMDAPWDFDDDHADWDDHDWNDHDWDDHDWNDHDWDDPRDGWGDLSTPYGVEWNGFSRELSIRAPLQQGLNTIKIGVADTGDGILDSALFISDLRLTSGGAGIGVFDVASPDPAGEVVLAAIAQEIILDALPNRIVGTAMDFANSVIDGFDTNDVMEFTGSFFELADILIEPGSVQLAIDSDGDGVRDTSVTLLGEYGDRKFEVTQTAGGTEVTVAEITSGAAARAVQIGDRAGTALENAEVSVRIAGYLPREGTSGADGVAVVDIPLEPAAASISAVLAFDAASAPAITTASALEALRIAVGLNPSWGPAGAMDFIAADFNGDGAVTTADALEILRVAVGLEAESAPRWVFIDPGADLSNISRSDTSLDPGIRFDDASALASDLSLTGILIGHVQEYA